MLKQFFSASIMLVSSNTIATEYDLVPPPAELDISVPQANCLKAVDVVKKPRCCTF